MPYQPSSKKFPYGGVFCYVPSLQLYFNFYPIFILLFLYKKKEEKRRKKKERREGRKEGWKGLKV